MGRVIRALYDMVFGLNISEGALNQERNAVLSEFGMINSVDWRLRKMQLQYLHNETGLQQSIDIGV